ncbi:MAG: hypothetical protein QGH51_02505 [Planctomycetota bacterium]|jgi:hypothetical protein|nr:hypothetical protein [Planctomycetota bacterium]
MSWIRAGLKAGFAAWIISMLMFLAFQVQATNAIVNLPEDAQGRPLVGEYFLYFGGDVIDMSKNKSSESVQEEIAAGGRLPHARWSITSNGGDFSAFSSRTSPLFELLRFLFVELAAFLFTSWLVFKWSIPSGKMQMACVLGLSLFIGVVDFALPLWLDFRLFAPPMKAMALYLIPWATASFLLTRFLGKESLA